MGEVYGARDTPRRGREDVLSTWDPALGVPLAWALRFLEVPRDLGRSLEHLIASSSTWSPRSARCSATWKSWS